MGLCSRLPSRRIPSRNSPIHVIPTSHFWHQRKGGHKGEHEGGKGPNKGNWGRYFPRDLVMSSIRSPLKSCDKPRNDHPFVALCMDRRRPRTRLSVGGRSLIGDQGLAQANGEIGRAHV